jgi:hypothetical protein
MASKKTIIALMYDFDKTLCTKDMQEYTFIPNLRMKAETFWAKSKDRAKKEQMDSVAAYMYTMLIEATAAQKSICRQDFVAAGKEVEFFPGVEDWFARINAFGKDQNVVIEHYIISSGLREIIEGTAICREFKKIYASEFHYNPSGAADWPKLLVNFTEKTQFLFRINKGVLDICENNELNKFKPDHERRIPFSNMIYLGDGFTDVPCMKLTRTNGGKSIAVYPNRRTEQVKELLKDNRVDFIAKADYSAESELEHIVKEIITNIVTSEKLISRHARQIKEISKNCLSKK